MIHVEKLNLYHQHDLKKIYRYISNLIKSCQSQTLSDPDHDSINQKARIANEGFLEIISSLLTNVFS